MMIRQQLAVGAALALTALVPSVASAGFTSWAVGSGEPDVLQILDKKYGLHNLERVEDFDADFTDQTWTNDGALRVSVVAKYSRMSQHFGFMAGESMGMNRLMTVRGRGMDLGQSAELDVAQTGTSFRFSNDPIGDRRGSSRMSDNYHGMDQMVTWRIVGNDGYRRNQLGSMVVAFEDRPTGAGSVDYNDLILEVERLANDGGGSGNGEEPVPEPATLLLLGMGAAGLAASRRRKK